MSTDDTTWERRAALSADARASAGMIRRMRITLTAEVTWQITGHQLLDGKIETRQAEAYTGVGFFSRPKSGSNAEAIVAFVGGSSNPMIIATRDEDARRAIAELEADSTAMFNTTTIIVVRADGTVEIRSSSGTALALPTLADYNALRAAYNAHTHTVSTTGTATAQTGTTTSLLTDCGPPDGTQVLKTE